MKERTLWRDEEAKFKPINKHAALIVRKASWWHLPPVEDAEPTFAPTLKEQAEIESRQRQERIAAMEAEEGHQKWLKAQQKIEAKSIAQKTRKWKRSAAKNMIAKALKRIAKQQGKPLPSGTEITQALALCGPKKPTGSKYTG